jgi:pimeloyl-ACP methyl ester carboxylesterase
MTEQNFRDMLLTAQMQARLASRGCSELGVEALAKQVGAKRSGVLVASYVTASWIEFSDHLHVSIQGTNDAHDWVQNLSARQTRIGGLTCHAGFHASAAAIHGQMISTLRFPLDKPTVLGGHSAGGAIAEIVAWIAKIPVREIVTFGAPRVWSVSSAPVVRAMPWRTHRFTVAGDPVPALPFRRFRRLFGKAEYAHSSQPLEITDDGRVLLDRGNSSLRKAVAVASGAWLYGLASVGLVKNWMPTMLSRHRIGTYADHIAKAVERVEA